MIRPRVLLPVALGTNRDQDLADAFTAAGADPECVPMSALRSGDRRLSDYQILGIPGGFSYGDALGAGRLLGLDLTGWFSDQLRAAQDSGMPMIGICNGFQALVRAGLLPGDSDAVLTVNASSQFECRWVTIAPNVASNSVWLSELTEPIRCPVAHGEGRFVTSDLAGLQRRNGVALTYSNADGLAGERYPANPNGSEGDVAGVTDPTGLILGLMPHPENHIRARQDVQRGRLTGGQALDLFRGAVNAVNS